MKTDIDHLPEEKQRELADIVSIIRKTVKPEKIILFGSYARGEWVEDRFTDEDHITHEYKSDMDILVVVKKDGSARMKTFDKIEHVIREDPQIKTDVSIIAHGIAEVNKKLSEGQYFFSDIIDEGIILYDSGKYEFAQKRELTPEERKRLAERDFGNWYESAVEFYYLYQSAYKRNTEKSLKAAAFQLHQVVERTYAAILLTFTQYKPRTHDIEKLGKLVTEQDHRFVSVFPRTDPFQERNFQLLKRAYVDARYDMNYKITADELEYLSERVKKLLDTAKEVCLGKIESFV